MALIEAMACGVPCIASLSGAIEEVAGDDALLCQPNDFLALYRNLRDLIRDPALGKDLGARARARAVQQFDIKSHADALSDVYESLVS